MLDKAILKYGVENFRYEVLYRISSDEDEVYDALNQKEIEYISKFGCIAPNGYNLTSGGRENGLYSEEARKKISESRRRFFDSGGETWNKGLHHSDETRMKISESRKGFKVSEESRRKMSESHKGRVHPNIGRKWTDEQREKFIKTQTGMKKKPCSEERKRKISEALKAFHKSKPKSPENDDK